ncbi:hypothetical protein [Nonlabens xiamenensis]|uniref:hypothetical protein n=1 Tax=Nonlabens xiamenensis TaxID=2341043 RepID=UPI000F60A29A|nr:hypothetical protein [Nonlabens xiamenensis]
MSKHPDIKRLDDLLNQNITWAVKIMAPDFGDAILKKNYRGEDHIWIHAGMVPDGDIYRHVTQLAKQKNLSRLDFEIKRKRGNSYDRIPSNQLSNNKFSVTIMNQQPQQAPPGNYAIPGVQPALAAPEFQSAVVGLSMPEIINLNQRKHDADRFERENMELKERLEKAENKIKEFEDSKPSTQDRLMAIAEQDGVALRVMDFLESLTKRPGSENAGQLAKPEVEQRSATQLPATIQQLQNILLQLNDERLNQKMTSLVYCIKNFEGFDDQIRELIHEHQEKQQQAEENLDEVA